MSKSTRTRDSPPTRVLHEIEGNGVTVKMRELGRTGIQGNPYCLGTMMFGQAGNTDRDDCVRIIHRALDSGINFVDTADVNSHSESEEIVGRALKGRRDDIGPLDVSYTPPAIKRASLRRRLADGRVAA